MNQKYIAIAAVVFIAWFSWFFRYDISDSPRGSTLDRWAGTIIDSSGDAADLSDAVTVEQNLAKLWASPNLFVSLARRAGYGDRVILDFLAKKTPGFDTEAARADGYSDQEILDELDKSKIVSGKPPATKDAAVNTVPPSTEPKQ